MRSTTLLALALPVIAAFPLDGPASSKHINKKRAEPAKSSGEWTQWDEDKAAMDGSKWAHPQSHEDGSEWAQEGWPESAKGNGDWTVWDEDEAAMDGSKWGPTSGRVGSENPQPPKPRPRGPTSARAGSENPQLQEPRPQDPKAQPEPSGTSGGRRPVREAKRPIPSPSQDTTDGQRPGVGNRNGGDPNNAPAPQPSQGSAEKQAGGRASSEHAQAALAKANELRRQHGSGAMEYDADLEAGAQQWADECASENKMFHSKDHSENIWSGSGQYTSDNVLTGAIESWYEEEPIYQAKIRYQEPTEEQIKVAFGPGATRDDMWGHFTQLVWRKTLRMGCAKSTKTDNKGNIYVVCRFMERGNVKGAYFENVKPKGTTS